MAQKTYTVKKGDTLSQIARSMGVGIGDISGYRSGDPNKIYEGETITIGKPQDYASEVKSQLTETEEPKKEKESAYDVTKIRSEIDDYKTKMDESFQKLSKVRKETYDSEYEKRGLGEKKQKISQIDTNIQAERAKRDEAINKIRQNPGLSQAQMTGQIKKIADFQNNVINNLIGERNSVAGEYNAELGEIDKIVGAAASDAENEYKYYAGLLNRADTSLSEYQKELRDQLKSDQDQENWERELAQALTIAQMRNDGSGSGGSNKTQLVRDEYGNPLYWFDPTTREITWIDGGEEDGADDSYDSIQVDTGSDEEDQPGYFGRLWNALLGR